MSVFQTADGDDIDPVFSFIGKISYCCKNHPERRSIHLFCIDSVAEFLKCFNSFINKLLTAEFDFNESVSAIPQMNDGIAL